MKISRVLVIGGAGYVGSHFCLFATKNGLDVTVMDNLSKGYRSALRCSEFIQADLLDYDNVLMRFSEHKYDAIFHFAANCLVGESVLDPAAYYRNNVISAYNMLEAMKATGHDKVIFSSTCAVYGYPKKLPLCEDHPKEPISPYGRTKLAIEWMLEDYNKAYGIKSARLRYFNAAGCEPDFGLGEDHRPETHLVPNVVRFALKLSDELTIFGNDYPTRDGTCIRDYIHVMDLADAHLKACARLDTVPLIRFNLGTGAGFTNLEVVDSVKRISGVNIVPKFGPRRPGDPAELVADASAAQRDLNWKPTRSDLDSIVKEVIKWFSTCPQGYPS
ncbi:MAG: UDP-glucose 4-epimerase GalE [Deltaproteobacteria bacterium]|nr:UDP-glucose 4-epimerase GalE [Deltaproteobacteria bacterium]